MSRNISRSKTQYENYLTLANNCQVVSKGGKPKPHLNPENILTDNIRQVWVTYELPAVCIIDLRNLIQKPLYFNRIGFRCWHQYGSNPKLIQIQYTGQDNPDNAVWVVLAKIRLELVSGWQHFKIQTLPMKNLSFLKVKIMQNHSQFRNKINDSDDADSHDNDNTSNFQYDDDAMTYLNQISLGYVEQIIQSRVQLTNANNITNHRQKTFSDFRKVTSTEKEIRRLYQKVKLLQSQGEEMRRTIDKQNGLILKLQNVVDMLVENVDKMERVQSIQEQKIKKLQKQRQKSRTKQTNYHDNRQQEQHYALLSHHKQKLQSFFHDESEIINETKPEKSDNSLWEHKKLNTQSGKRKSQYEQQKSHSSKQNSYYKAKGKISSNQKRPQYSNKRQVVNANIDESEDSLSEYEGIEGQRMYQRQRARGTREIKDKKQLSATSKQKAYIPMLQKLQELILLRDEKKNRLRTGKKPSHHHHRHRKQNVVIDYDSSDQQQNEKQQYDNYTDNNNDD